MTSPPSAPPPELSGTVDATVARACVDHLVARGLLPAGGGASVESLTGGVSCDVFAVRSAAAGSVAAGSVDVVVKRALPKLRVAADWYADPARIDTEGRALRLAGRLLPAAVPEVLDLADGWLVIRRAPRTWTVWKDDLMAGVVDVRVAARLGSALGVWQAATAGDPEVRAAFGDREAFRQLRVEPFLLRVAERNPAVAPAVHRTVDVMLATTACLVHGDFTPKNMLVGPAPSPPPSSSSPPPFSPTPSALPAASPASPVPPFSAPAVAESAGHGPPVWVLDWEVAHVGDPTFDLGSMLGHLLVKSVHRPSSAAAYETCAAAFLGAVTTSAGAAVPLPADQIVRQTACMVLARVDGTSPLGYLSEPARLRLRALGHDLLLHPPAVVTDAWSRLP